MNSYVGDCSGHTCRHVPGRCLGCAVFANICKDRPGTICNSQWPQPRPGHRSRSWAQARVHTGPRADVGDDIEIWLCPGHQDISPGVPGGVSVLSSFTPDHQTPAPWRVACALAWPELVNVRELGQWQRAKWNDITQVAEYFINPAAPAHRPLSETKQIYWTWIFSRSW